VPLKLLCSGGDLRAEFGIFKNLYYIYKQNKTDMSRTSKDFQRELMESIAKTKSLESGIKDRLIKLIRKYPDSVFMKKGIDVFYCRQLTKELVDNMSPETMLMYMRNIEEYNLSLQSTIQLSFDF
jgi:hypothetical protein